MKKLYVFRAVGGSIKIGISRNPSRRLASMTMGGLVGLVWETDEAYVNAREIESEVHVALLRFSAGGEWFGCGARVAIREIRRVAAERGSLVEVYRPRGDIVNCPALAAVGRIRRGDTVIPSEHRDDVLFLCGVLVGLTRNGA